MRSTKRSHHDRVILSECELRLFIALLKQTGWWTCDEIAEKAALKRRIVHEHLTRWLAFGILERIKLSPEHRWRMGPGAAKQNHYARMADTATRLGWMK